MGKIVKIEQKKKSECKYGGQILRKINNFLLNYFDYVIIVTVLIILVSGFFIVIKPKYELVIQDVQLAKINNESEYLIQESYFGKLKKFKNVFDNVEIENKRKIDIILPEKVNVEEFFREIEAIVSKSGLILTSLNIAKDEAGEAPDKSNKNKTNIEISDNNLELEKVGKIKITMNVLGVDYDNFKKFIGVIENNLRLMDIENINFSLDGKSVSLDLITYYMREN